MSKYPNWTEEELEILKLNYNSGEKNEIISLLPRREWQGIKTKAQRIGLFRMDYFTEEELKFISDNYNTMTSYEIGDYLGRNGDSVGRKIRELGFIRQEFWTEEENDILRENYKECTSKYISENLLQHRTASSIRHQVQYLKLSETVYHYTKEELLVLLKDLAEKLGRTPTSIEITKYGLPFNSVFIRLFGGYRNACEILGLDANETIFKQTKKYLSKNGDGCDSKAEQIITNFMIDNCIDYSKDGNYKDICFIGKPGKKRYDWLLENNIIVEYFGLMRKERYRKRVQEKIELCFNNKIRLLQIFEKDLFKLEEVFKEFIKS